MGTYSEMENLNSNSVVTAFHLTTPDLSFAF